MATNLLRLPEVERRVGLKSSAIYRRIQDGTFPRPVSLGGKHTSAVAWKENEIEDWIASLAISTQTSPRTRDSQAHRSKSTPSKPWAAPGSTAS